MGPEEQARREQAFWENRRREEERFAEQRRRDAERLQAEARRREQLDRERRQAEETVRRDTATKKQVLAERERRVEAWRKAQEPPPPPPPPRAIPLDAVGRRKAALAQKEALAARGPMKLPNGVRASRLIQSLGPMERGSKR